MKKVQSTVRFVEMMNNHFYKVQRTEILILPKRFIKEDIAVRCTLFEYI